MKINQIVESLESNQDLREYCRILTKDENLSDDLYQEFLLAMLTHKDSKLIEELHAKGDLIYWCRRVLLYMWKSESSDFYKGFRGFSKSSINPEGVLENLPEIQEEQDPCFDHYLQEVKKHKATDHKIMRKKCFSFYMKYGSFRKAEKHTGINYKVIEYHTKSFIDRILNKTEPCQIC